MANQTGTYNESHIFWAKFAGVFYLQHSNKHLVSLGSHAESIQWSPGNTAEVLTEERL